MKNNILANEMLSSAAEVANENLDPTSEVASHRQSEAGQNFVGSPPQNFYIGDSTSCVATVLLGEAQ